MATLSHTLSQSLDHTNMKHKLLFPILLALLLPGQLLAQCEGVYYDYLDGNQVKARLNNGGDMFWNLNNGPSYEVVAGSNRHAAFASSAWIGGLDDTGGLHLAAQTYRQSGLDFFPGPYRTTGNYDCGQGYLTNFLPSNSLALSTGKVMLIGPAGFEVFDPVTGVGQSGIFPAFRTFADGIELADGRILIFGDLNGQAKEPLYFVDGTTFVVTTSNITLSDWHAYSSATQLATGDVLFVGFLGCERLDLNTSGLTTVPSPNTNRVRHESNLLPNGQVWISGGSTTLGGAIGLNSTEFYNAGTNTWTNGPTMSIGRVGHSLTTMPNGEIILTGGNSTSPVVEHFDPNTQTFVSSTLIDRLFLKNTASAMPNGEVALIFDEIGQFPQMYYYTPGVTNLREGHLARLKTNGVALPNGNMVQEFDGGVYREIDPMHSTLVGDRWQKMWKVSKSQIDQFLADYQSSNIDFANYPDIETWPALGNTTLGEDQYLAPFVDINGDGQYDPLLYGDHPCIEGDQALWWVYNDDAEAHTETGGDKLGIQVEVMAYAYDCQAQPCNNTTLETTTFYHYEISNKSGQDYHDVYFSYWMDADLGNFSDDYIGCDSARGMGFVYNGDNYDEPSSGGYGNNPPALGSRFMSAPGPLRLSNFMYYENDFTVQGNPQNAADHYNLMRSFWLDGTPLTVGGDGYGGTTPTNFIYPGDPGWCGGPSSGWSEVSEGNQPFDRRYLQSYGPFDLPADSSVEFDLAIVFTRAFSGSNLASVCELLQASDSVKSFFDQQDHDCFNSLVGIEEPDLVSPQVSLFPNPTAGTFRIELEESLTVPATISISDQMGRMVRQARMAPGQSGQTISTSELPNGIYLVNLQGIGFSSTTKLVVQH